MAMLLMPGSEDSRASTTRRMFGLIEISRSTRNTRSARSTANGPLDGTRATPTTRQSNTAHGSRSKPRPRATKRSASSRINTARIS